MELKDKAKELPNKPGVYLMKDSIGNIIYIGKSKSLRNRVSSYFLRNKNHSSKIQDMISNINSFGYILTDTELEALLLESKLIKENKPMYNRQLKNIKRYVYIKITCNEKFPRILPVYDMDDSNCTYFGPYTSLGSVEDGIGFLKDTYPIIQCNNPSNRKSVCLNYHLKRCGGICEGLESQKNYKKYIEDILEFLKGRKQDLVEDLENKMKKAAQELDFDKASKYRDQLSGIRSILNTQETIRNSKKNKEYMLIEPINDEEYKVFYLRGNMLKGKKIVTSKDISERKINKLLDEFSTKYNSKMKFNIYDLNFGEAISKENIDEIRIISSYIKKEKERLKLVKIK